MAYFSNNCKLDTTKKLIFGKILLKIFGDFIMSGHFLFWGWYVFAALRIAANGFELEAWAVWVHNEQRAILSLRRSLSDPPQI